MLMSFMDVGGKLTCRVSRYNLYSTLPFASGRVANRCPVEMVIIILNKQ